MRRKPIALALLALLVLTFESFKSPAKGEFASSTLQGQKKSSEFAKGFKGRKADYIRYILEGGCYVIDDEPEYEWCGLVNNALLILAKGADTPAWKANPVEQFGKGSACKAYSDQLLWNIRHNRIPEDANRVWADTLESYLLFKHLFTPQEQREIERWMCEKAKTYAEARSRRWGHQYVPHAFAALTACVLKRSDTGEDFSKDIMWLETYARDKAHSFSRTFGPIENSGHYIMYVLQSLFRLSLYLEGDGERFPNAYKPNLRKAVRWLLDVYPHNGFAVTYGTEWSWVHTPRLIDFLHAASWALKDGNESDTKLAREAKWLATEMFRFGLSHPAPARTRVEWTPHETKRSLKSGHGTQSNPIWLWRYIDDSLKPLRPDPNEHSSKVVHGEYGSSWSEHLELKASKVVHRSGWDKDAFYILLDLAPRCAKSMPYANAICDISFGQETFTPGHKLEQGNAGNQQRWDERITVAPHNGDKWDAEVVWFKNYEDYSASRTDEGKWSRIISFIKDEPYAAIFDFAPNKGIAHWQFISRPDPKWMNGCVELCRSKRKMRFYWANDKWYEITNWNDSRVSTPNSKDDVWVVDEPARRLKIESAGTWALAVVPVHGEPPKSVESLDPRADGKPSYPEAAGLRLVFQGHTDWHGAQKANEMLDYGEISTDSELFFARRKGKRWNVYFINGGKFIFSTSRPTRILTDNEPLEHERWQYENGRLIITPPAKEGVLAW
jgi:hypothetical protein